jgi:hypothetical protein
MQLVLGAQTEFERVHERDERLARRRHQQISDRRRAAPGCEVLSGMRDRDGGHGARRVECRRGRVEIAHLSRLGNPFPSFRARLRRVLDCRRHAHPYTMERRGMVHLEQERVAQPM